MRFLMPDSSVSDFFTLFGPALRKMASHVCKVILTVYIPSSPVGLRVRFLVLTSSYDHILCVRTGKALARLRIRAGSPVPSLFAYQKVPKSRVLAYLFIMKTSLLTNTCIYKISMNYIIISLIECIQYLVFETFSAFC